MLSVFVYSDNIVLVSGVPELGVPFVRKLDLLLYEYPGTSIYGPGKTYFQHTPEHFAGDYTPHVTVVKMENGNYKFIRHPQGLAWWLTNFRHMSLLKTQFTIVRHGELVMKRVSQTRWELVDSHHMYSITLTPID